MPPKKSAENGGGENKKKNARCCVDCVGCRLSDPIKKRLSMSLENALAYLFRRHPDASRMFRFSPGPRFQRNLSFCGVPFLHSDGICVSCGRSSVVLVCIRQAGRCVQGGMGDISRRQAVSLHYFFHLLTDTTAECHSLLHTKCTTTAHALWALSVSPPRAAHPAAISEGHEQRSESTMEQRRTQLPM